MGDLLTQVGSQFRRGTAALVDQRIAAIASPCTAPFMGVVLDTALTQPAPQALAIFAALGVGMAAPYLLE